MRQRFNEIKNVIDKHEYTINDIIFLIMNKFNFKTICCKLGKKSIKNSSF